MKENEYQAYLIKKLEKNFKTAIVLKNDPNYRQGIPDLTIFHGENWATLEVKKSKNAPHRPNQDYYVDRMNVMSYSAFIYPENEEEIFDELEQALRPRRKARVSKSERVSLDQL